MNLYTRRAIQTNSPLEMFTSLMETVLNLESEYM